MPPKKAQGAAAPREDPQQYVLRKNFKKAIELYRVLVKEAPNDANQGLRLADCLVLDGQSATAVEEYKRVARLYAEQGFLLKAIGVNKKVVKLDPAQEDVHQSLSKLYEERGLLASPGGGPSGMGSSSSSSSTVTASPAGRGGAIQFDMEEDSGAAGMELDLGLGGGATRTGGASASGTAHETVDLEASDALDSLSELDGLDAATLEAASDLAGGDPSAESLAPDSLTPGSLDFGSLTSTPGASGSGASGLGGFPFGAVEVPRATSSGASRSASLPEEISVDDLGDALSELPAGSASAETMNALGLDFANDPLGSGDAGPAPADDRARRTPLFSDFTADEFVEVVTKMGQEAFPKGSVIVREGDPGDALFVIVTGSVKVMTKAKGRDLLLAELHEGDFFGEGSLITGKPRTATIIAGEDAELLSLSKSSLDEIASVHPRVRDVMKQFYQQRAENTVKTILGSKK